MAKSTSAKTEKEQKSLRKKLLLRTKIDLCFLIAVILINIIGMIMIYSASYYYAMTTYHKAPSHFFVSQLVFVSIGIVVMLLVSFIRPNTIRITRIVMLVLAVALIVAVRIPGLGHSSHGAYRWISILGLTLQVAEPIKLCLIIAAAGFLAKYRPKWRYTSPAVLIVIGLFSLAIYFLTNNLSTALIVFLMVFFTAMLTSRHMKSYWVTMAIGAALIALFVLIIALTPPNAGEGFRFTRIRAWLDPTNELYAGNEAYQSVQAKYAIASGGFFGKGLGQSLLKFKLPEPHNDYILAIVFEELGIFGVIILTYLFIYLLYKIFRVFLNASESFSRYMVLGVFFHLSIQIILNYAVTLGVIPTMGVTLPFISAGGSSALFTLAELGLVMSVARQNEEDRLYKDARNEIEANDPYYKMLIDERKEKRQQRENRRSRSKEDQNG